MIELEVARQLAEVADVRLPARLWHFARVADDVPWGRLEMGAMEFWRTRGALYFVSHLCRSALRKRRAMRVRPAGTVNRTGSRGL